MNRGILYKSFRETVWITLLFGVALAALEAMLAGVIPAVFNELPTQWRLEFIAMITHWGHLLEASAFGSALGTREPSSGVA